MNLLIVFTLCGLWHGASWTFVAWGLYHGIFLSVERVFRDVRIPTSLRPIGHVYTLVVVWIGWVIFRATSIEQTLAMVKALFGFGAVQSQVMQVDAYLTPLFVLVGAAACIGSMPTLPLVKSWWLQRIEENPSSRWALGRGLAGVASMVLLLLASALQLSDASHNPFIYFRF